MKISVIIPIYNVSQYLKEALDSIVEQTYHDIEIICINDGSTDNSLQIIGIREKRCSRHHRQPREPRFVCHTPERNQDGYR